MYENTEFTLSRDCEAIQIPSGQKTTVPAGTQGVITQSLGGSYTIATYQGLARIAEKDLDALGLKNRSANSSKTCEHYKRGSFRGRRLEPAPSMLRPGDPGEHCRSWPRLRLPVDQKTGRRHQSGSENDFDRARLRDGPGDRARCAEQDSVHRWHR